jgi:hypothetical protein
MVLYEDWANTTQNATITIVFSAPVANVSLYAGDIDKVSATETGSANYLDRVTVSGITPTGAIANSIITRYDPASAFNIIAGNSAYATAVSGTGGNAPTNAVTNAAQAGTVLFTIPNAITTLTIRHDNFNSTTFPLVNPGGQAIAVGDISFVRAPPTANNIIAPVENNSYGQTSIPSLFGAVIFGTITNYTIQSIPTVAQGVLYLCNPACAAVTAGQPIVEADKDKLKFDPAPGFIGNATFTYNATSNTGTISNSATYTIPVNNNPPIANPVLSQVILNSSGAVPVPALSGADPDGTIANFTITTIPLLAEGILSLCNPTCNPVTANQVIALADIAKLQFDPAAGFVGNVVFNYTATDNSGSISPAAKYIIPISGLAPINFPPVSDNIVAPQLSNSNASTLIPALAGHDADGTIATYRIETIPVATQGTLTYCSNGTNPCTGTVTSIAAAVDLTPVQMATLKFDPLPSYIGTATFTYSSTDNGGTKSNIADYSIPVINNIPVANPITTPDMNNTFGQTAIPTLSGFDDNSLASYNITTIPAAASGLLYLCNPGCVLVTAGQSIALADIGSLKFDPAAGFNGNATFNYTTTDNNGTISAAAPFTIPIITTSVVTNLSPVANNIKAPALFNTDGQIAIPTISSADPDGTIAGYTVNSIPPASQGVLYLCNPTCVAVTQGQAIALADIAKFTFDPAAGYEGNALFNYTSTDNLGKLSNIATYTIPVMSFSPLANNVQSVAMSTLNGATAIPSLVATDADGTILNYTIKNLPATSAGILYLCNPACAVVTAGQVVLPADIAKLQFDPAAGFSGIYTQFDYIATDNTGKISNTATFTIPLGLPPVSSTLTNTTLLNTFSATVTIDPAATDDGTIVSYFIETIPAVAEGLLTYFDGTSFVAVTANKILTSTEAASIKFDPAAGFIGNATFTYSTIDNVGMKSAVATINIPVDPLMAPTANNITAPAENSSYGQTSIPALSASVAWGTISTYTVQTIPTVAQGVLYLCNATCNAVVPGQIITEADKDKLKFDPAPDFTGNATFTYIATSDIGNASNSAIYTIPVNNNPPIANPVLSQVILNSSGAVPVPALSGADPDGTITNFTITTVPLLTEGILSLCNPTCNPVTASQVIALADIAKLQFDPAVAFFGNVAFNYTVTDNSGNISPAANYIIPISTPTPINFPPVSDNIVASQLSNSSASTLIPALAGHDADGTIATYRIETIPLAAQGTLTYCSNGTEPCTGVVTVIAGITNLTPLQMATLKFDPLPSYIGTATFTYSSTDNGGTKSNIADYSIPVINNIPVANPITTPAMNNTFGQTAIPALSGYDDNSLNNYNITSIPAAASGLLYLCNPGCVLVTAGQSIALADIGKLRFDPVAGFVGNAAFNYTTTDNNGTISAAAPFTIPIVTTSLTNLSPVANNITAPALFNTDGQIAIPAISSTDPDGTISEYTVSSIPPASQGILYLCNPTCVVVTQGQAIALADIAKFTFDPAAGYEGNALFNYTSTDNLGKISNIATYTIPVMGFPPLVNNVQSVAMSTLNGATAIPSLVATDADGTILNYTIKSLPATSAGILYLCNPACAAVTAGQVILPADIAKLQFDPAAGFIGIYTQFDYIATDNTGKISNTATYTIPLGLPPVSSTLTNTTLLNIFPATITIDPAATDDGTIVSYFIETIPAVAEGLLTYFDGTSFVAVTVNKILTPTEAASIRFDPAPGFTGNATFTYSTIDNVGMKSAVATVNIPVDPLVAPLANNITAPAENSSYGQTSIPALSASVASGTISTYTVQTIPAVAQGVLYLCNAICNAVAPGQIITEADKGKLKFDPAPSFSGNATFTYIATSDIGNTSNSAIYTIPVNNNPPVANTIISQILINTDAAIDIPSLSGADPDGTVSSFKIPVIPLAAEGLLTYFNAISSTRVAVAPNQILTPTEAASLKFDPAAGYIGTVRFNYTVTDNTGNISFPAVYNIPVKGAAAVNLPPISDNIDAPQMLNNYGPILIPNLVGHDIYGSIIAYTIETVTAGQGILSYCSNGTEPCTGLVTAIAGIASLTPAQMATLKFDPAPGFTGTASFTYSSTNSSSTKSNIANYSLPIVNPPPVANPVTTAAMSNTFGQTAIPALSGSENITIVNYTVSTIPSPASGILYLCNPACAVVLAGQVLLPADVALLKFDPAPGFSGNAQFNFFGTDNNGAVSQTAIYTIPIINTSLAANLPPVADNKLATPIANTSSQTAILSLSGSDPDGTISGFTITSIPSATQQGELYLCNPTCNLVTVGQVILPADAAKLKFDPITGFDGNAIFDYISTDAAGKLSNVATFTIPVTSVPPQAISIQTLGIPITNGMSTISGLSGTDPDGTVSSFTITSLPPANSGILFLCTTVCSPVCATVCNPVTVGQVIAAADKDKIKFTPNGSFKGIYSQFNYTATDNTGRLSNTATYTIPMFPGSTLPVAIVNFMAEKQNSIVHLSWNTIDEANYSSHVVERSIDGIHFTSVTSLPAKNSSKNNYHTTDDISSLKATIIYYRIRLVSNDGRFKYSDIATVSLNGKLATVRVLPNPVVDKINIRISIDAATTGEIRIIDALGQVVYRQRERLLKGENAITINNLQPLAKGIYTLQVSMQNTVLNTQFISIK